MSIQRKWKQLFSILLCCSMFLGIMTIKTYANSETTTRTTVLDLTKSEFDQNQENLAEGWKWEAATATLTLTNANFQTSGYGIIFPISKNPTLRLVGENTITSQKQTLLAQGRSSNKLTISGDGKLAATTLEDLPTFDMANIEFVSGTIVAVGGINTFNDIKISGGSLSVDTTGFQIWQDGLYACGSIEITGGSVDVKAERVGLFVPGTGAQYPGIGLKITGGDVHIQGAVAATYVGIDYRKDTVIDTTGSLTLHDSPIGFYANDGDIKIEKGDIILDNIDRPIGIANGETTIAAADYTKVDEAITKAQALNKDEYKNFSAVEAAVQGVVRDKYFFEQAKADAMAEAIEEAIAALEYKNADYTKVDEAIVKAQALDKDAYVDVSAVEAAMQNVVRGKNLFEQADVDAMAEAIEQAMANLQVKDADYAKVDKAVTKANALNKGNYKNFSTVEVAVQNVVRGKNFFAQADVDAMAEAIEQAMANLQVKDADYAKVDEAITKANALNKGNYKDFSAVEAAIQAVVRGKNLFEQADVDAMAEAIEQALAALEKKSAPSIDPTESKGGTTDKTNSETAVNPQTADNSNQFLWMMLMLISLAGLQGIVKFRKANT